MGCPGVKSRGSATPWNIFTWSRRLPFQVLSSFCHLGGVSPQWEVVDVWGLDPDLLGFVPQPVLALILLFPTKDEQGEKVWTPQLAIFLFLFLKVKERLQVEEHPVSASTYFLRQVKL